MQCLRKDIYRHLLPQRRALGAVNKSHPALSNFSIMRWRERVVPIISHLDAIDHGSNPIFLRIFWYLGSEPTSEKKLCV